MTPAPLVSVRALIARTVAGGGDAPTRVGDVVLHASQREAVRRASGALRMFRGVLIADDVGAGKTYIALALAQTFARPCVVAPAVLRDMWSGAALRARIPLPFTSVESLGHGAAPRADADVFIIDEAHHLRNPATRRYAAMASAARGTHVILLTATPIHNTARDLDTLLALFLGADAKDLDEEGRACVVVRATRALSGPPVIVHPPVATRDSRAMITAIRGLAPPAATRGGGSAPVLLRLALLRAWCSSVGAFSTMLRRAALHAAAFRDALHANRFPSRAELRAWSVDDDGQLAFAELISGAEETPAACMPAVDHHLNALSALRALARDNDTIDDDRAETLRAIARAHRGVPVLACTQYAATVDALWTRLRHDAGVAALTARGARIASGPITREQALSRFAPHATGNATPHMRERITVLITTDVVSEGLNLHDAGIVVHLDLPWTAARLAQRVGRVARFGSRHAAVHAFTIAPPRAAAAMLALTRRLRTKQRIATHIVGENSRVGELIGIEAHSRPSAPEARARITELLQRHCNSSSVDAPPLICGVHAPHDGWLAIVDAPQGPRLVSKLGTRPPTTDPRDVLAAVELLATHGEHWLPATWHDVLRDAERWLAFDRGRRIAGSQRLHAASTQRRAVAGAMRSVASTPSHLRASEAFHATARIAPPDAPLATPPRSLIALVVFCSGDPQTRRAPLRP